jgi:glycosyltransferase involved in cell wall biosynthesis
LGLFLAAGARPIYNQSVRTLILAAGRFGGPLKDEIAAGREPRLDVFELRDALRADVLDYDSADACKSASVRATRRTAGISAALALMGAQAADRYDSVLTTGEELGIPFAMLLAGKRRRPAHTMIAHTLTPWKKRVFFHFLRVQGQIDRILCYATSEERHIVDVLGVDEKKVIRIAYHADELFFRPMPEVPVTPGQLCSAGQLLRDYDGLIAATKDLPVTVRIAAGSPWIASELKPGAALPANVDWRRYNRNDLRDLYARSELAIVPILQNDYQTGISTILEMMAMGKCVIASRTRGQTDTIVDGVNGVYVPPGDPAALRATIERLLKDPETARRIGAEARRYIEREAGLGLFVSRIAATMQEASQELAAA